MPTLRSSGCPYPTSWFRAIVAVAALALAGCNANQGVNVSPQSASQTFAGRYADDNPYNPISYAQNNTGRGGGGH